MSLTHLSVYVEEYHLRELQKELKKQDTTVGDYMQKAFHDAYETLVSPQRRYEINKELERSELADQVMRGAVPRYSVIRITQNGESNHFMSLQYQKHYNLALEYAIREGLAEPPVEGYEPLKEMTEIRQEQFEQALGDDSPALHSILSVNEDENTFSYAYSISQEWHTGSLSNAMDAAAQASQAGPRKNKDMVFLMRFIEKGLETIPIEPKPEPGPDLTF